MNVVEQMREDWNRRAREDANYFVAFARLNDEEFLATGASVIAGFEAELYRLPRASEKDRRNVLAKLVQRLTGDAIKQDVETLCGAEVGEMRGASAPRLELELRRAELSGVADCAAARLKLERAWALPKVACALAISRQTQTTFDPASAAGWSIDRLPECKAVAADSGR